MSIGVYTGSPFEELDFRQSDGIEVSLLWSRADDSLSVLVVDTKTEELLEVPVHHAEAMDVFRHPISFAPSGV
jgi:hypothetical protein